MDFTSIDITGFEGCRIGERAVLLGSGNGEEISVQEMAKKSGTIPYEILCHIGRLAERRYME